MNHSRMTQAKAEQAKLEFKKKASVVDPNAAKREEERNAKDAAQKQAEAHAALLKKQQEKDAKAEEEKKKAELAKARADKFLKKMAS